MATIYDTIRIRDLTNKWEQKKQNYTRKATEDTRTPEQKQMDQMMEMLKRERDSNQKSAILSGIDAKIKSGGELTPDEISYLKENDPEKLRDYEEVKAEKESYKQKLKACKTKEDVARVKMTALGNFMSQAKAIDSSPYIPKDKKLAMMSKLASKVANCEQAHQKFVKSQAYRDMPVEEEVREAAEEKKEVLQVSPVDAGETAEDTGAAQKMKQTDNKDFSDVGREINEFFKRNDDEKRHFVVKA